MVARPFLSGRFMTVTVPRLRARGLETRLGIDGRSVNFEHPDGTVVTCDVVIEWASRLPEGSGEITVDVIGTSGELTGRPGELVVPAGSRFQLDGHPCEITVGAKVDRGVAVAAFRMSEGG